MSGLGYEFQNGLLGGGRQIAEGAVCSDDVVIVLPDGERRTGVRHTSAVFAPDSCSRRIAMIGSGSV